MKTKLTLALVAIITNSAFAAIPKVLPEFKNEKQLAEWRAEMAAKAESEPSKLDVRSSTLDVPPAFYTGKPYIESTGSYAFKYRSYNPELARWTSEDPSGFPDGANGSAYAAVPSSEFDFQGLFSVEGMLTPNPQLFTTTTGGKTYTTTALNIGIIAPQDGASLDGTMTIENYWAKDFSNALGAEISIEMSGIPAPVGNMEYHWMQSLYIVQGGQSTTQIDDGGAGTGFYDTIGAASADHFIDKPRRPPTAATAGNPFLWIASLTYIGYIPGSGTTILEVLRGDLQLPSSE